MPSQIVRKLKCLTVSLEDAIMIHNLNLLVAEGNGTFRTQLWMLSSSSPMSSFSMYHLTFSHQPMCGRQQHSVLYYDGTAEYFRGETHSLCCLVVLLLLLLLLYLYPCLTQCFHRFLKRCKQSSSSPLHGHLPGLL